MLDFSQKLENRFSRGSEWTIDGFTYRVRNYVKYAKRYENGVPVQYDLELYLVDPKEIEDENCKEVHLNYAFYNLNDETFLTLLKENGYVE